MEIRYVKGDATTPVGKGNKMIVHVCNDVGGWGKGFVTAISSKWKNPEEEYRNWYQSKEGFALGEARLVQVEVDTWIANMLGQRDIRANKDGEPPVRYGAIGHALEKVAAWTAELTASVHMPRIGCGLAGGKWELMEAIILQKLVSKGIVVTVYDL